MPWLRIFLFSLFLPSATLAQVAAVTQFYPNEINVFKDRAGEQGHKTVKTKDLVVPAAQLSKESDYGTIMVELRFKQTGRKALIGWVDSSAVKLDTVPEVDIESDCAKKLVGKATVTRGIRGLGDRC